MSKNSFEFTSIIESVGSLDELLDAWIANRQLFEKSDCTELPTFGGNEPEDTNGIWSWDDSRILTGASYDDLSIENRCKREKEPWEDGVIAAIRENGWAGKIGRADIALFECFFGGFMGGFEDPAFEHQVELTIADMRTRAKIANLEEKIKNRDLNLAHRDHLIDELERKNRALTHILESLTGASFDDLSIENRCKREEVAR